MFEVPLVTSSNIIQADKFWESILLYHDKPHLVNRKLAAVSQISFSRINFKSPSVRKVTELLTRPALLYELRKLKSLSRDHLDSDFIVRIVECYDKNVSLTECSKDEFREAYNDIFISLRILLPRIKQCEKAIEIVVLDKIDQIATFISVSEDIKMTPAPIFPFKITLPSTGHLTVILQSIEDADTSSAEWISEKLFEKLIKWTEKNESDNNRRISSLSLIKAEDYCDLYSKLKLKYGDPLVKVWSTKAKTDPKKYIFEDIAIASYLICLWKMLQVDDIKFVDLGCGNGLLVNILTQEGYEGYGVDLRRRDVWDLFPKSINLQVATVMPSSLYPESTWLIGNHSDELTPWIPYMALKGSANFFLLPCCPFDFNGKKFIRTNTALSQYSGYLNYIEDFCKLCNFDSKIDKLRIPSTKRTCIVGLKKEDTTSFQDIIERVDKFVKGKFDNSVDSFTPRPSKEKVQNCTQLDRKFVHNFLIDIVRILLEKEDYIITPEGKKWNRGGSIPLGELPSRLLKENLKKLKNECGGLQTLLRNHRYIFDVSAGGVRIRLPLLLDESTKKYKSKPCWFKKNHPEGCFYDSLSCAYDHC